jgi:hypothetical protein
MRSDQIIPSHRPPACPRARARALPVVRPAPQFAGTDSHGRMDHPKKSYTNLLVNIRLMAPSGTSPRAFHQIGGELPPACQSAAPTHSIRGSMIFWPWLGPAAVIRAGSRGAAGAFCHGAMPAPPSSRRGRSATRTMKRSVAGLPGSVTRFLGVVYFPMQCYNSAGPASLFSSRQPRPGERRPERRRNAGVRPRRCRPGSRDAVAGPGPAAVLASAATKRTQQAIEK